jgi:NAD(P)-dependent dehydrogenase (short-subunit alcohol dehydrogenase family)
MICCYHWWQVQAESTSIIITTVEFSWILIVRFVTFQKLLPPTPKVMSLIGKTICILTGATNGIGRDATFKLVKLTNELHLILACRSKQKGLLCLLYTVIHSITMLLCWYQVLRSQQWVIVVSSTLFAAESLIEELRRQSPNCSVEFIQLDLESFASVRTFVDEFHARKLPLHILILNAGERTI